MNPVVRNIPNVMTLARLLLLPLIVWLYAEAQPDAAWGAAWVVLFAALSDVVDGILARRLQVQSEFGRWVDPLVDRIFFFCLLGMLLYFDTLPWLVVVPLLVRDGLILLLALPARRYSEGPQISRWGKLANFILMGGILWFMIDVRLMGWLWVLVGGSLYVGSGLLYLYRAMLYLRSMKTA